MATPNDMPKVSSEARRRRNNEKVFYKKKGITNSKAYIRALNNAGVKK